MIWVSFPSLSAFDAWHNEIKKNLGLPKVSTDVDGNEKPDAILTTDYVQPYIVSENDVRALIDDIYLHDLDNQVHFGIVLSESPIVRTYASQS